MASKSHNQPGRRTPLSLGGTTKQNQSTKNTLSLSGNISPNSKYNQNLSNQQSIEIRESSQKDLKQQQQEQTDKKADVKKSQNGEENGKSNSTTAKEKQQQHQQLESLKKNYLPKGSTNGQSIKDEKLEKISLLDKEEKTEKILKQSVVIVMEPTKECGKISNEKKEKERFSEKKEKDTEKRLEIKLKKSDSKSSTPIDKKKLNTNEVFSITSSKNDEQIKAEISINTEKSSSIKNNDDVLIKKKKKSMESSESKEIGSGEIISSSGKLNTQDVTLNPSATSTPGKLSENKLPILTIVEAQKKTDYENIPLEPITCIPTFAQVSCRRSIRPLTEYTPSSVKINNQFRGSYRLINTELDLSSLTNTSMNATVGSEVPNNSSFSFFGRGRKRDRTTPPLSQSAIELQNDTTLSPPKRRRVDLQNFFSVVASPLTLLRARFARNSIQNDTFKKKNVSEDEGEVQNVSGILIEEEIPYTENGKDENVEKYHDVQLDTKPQDNKSMESKKCSMQSEHTSIDDEDSFSIAKTKIASEDIQPKDKKCIIM